MSAPRHVSVPRFRNFSDCCVRSLCRGIKEKSRNMPICGSVFYFIQKKKKRLCQLPPYLV